MTRYARRFRRIHRALSRVALMQRSVDELALSDHDLLDKDGGRRFLDFYGDEGLRMGLERYGLLSELEARGYTSVEIDTTAHDDRHTLLLDGIKDGETHRVVELVVRRDRLHIDAAELTRGWDVLTVDWLAMQDPTRAFTRERLRLPGQTAPGLGLGEQVLELMYRVVERLSLDGLLTVAEHFHNAVLYARELPYVDPWFGGQLRALSHLLFDREHLSFAQGAWAMHWGHVIDVDDRVVRWTGEAMLYAFEPELRAYLTGKEHAEAEAHVASELRYRLDRTAFDEQWSASEADLLSPPIKT